MNLFWLILIYFKQKDLFSKKKVIVTIKVKGLHFYLMPIKKCLFLLPANLGRRVEDMSKAMESEKKEQERNLRLAYS